MLITNSAPSSNIPESVSRDTPKENKVNIFEAVSNTQTNERTTKKQQRNFTIKKEGFDEGCFQCICCFANCFALACESTLAGGGYRPVRGRW